MDSFIAESKVDLGLKNKRSERFLRGPIPWNWLGSAAALGGKSLAVAVAIAHLKGLRQSLTFRLEPARLRELGVSRQSAYRALNQLEKAGLISVVRSAGAAPTVTVRWGTG